MNLLPILHKVGMFVKRNAPLILTGIGVLGVAETTVLAIKQTKKQEPNYTPVIISGVVTAGCIVGGAYMQAVRTHEIAMAFNNLAHRMTNYKTAIDKLGTAAVVDSVSRLEVEHPEEMEHLPKIETTGDGRDEEVMHWFWFEYSNIWFKSTWKQVYYAEIMLKNELGMNGFAPVNRYLYSLDLPEIDYNGNPLSNMLGFDIQTLAEAYETYDIDFSYDDVTAPNGDPGFSISWKNCEPEISDSLMPWCNA